MFRRLRWYAELVVLSNSKIPEVAQLVRAAIDIAGWTVRPGRSSWRASFHYAGLAGEMWLRFRTRRKVPEEYRIPTEDGLFVVRYNYERKRIVKPRRKRDGLTGAP